MLLTSNWKKLKILVLKITRWEFNVLEVILTFNVNLFQDHHDENNETKTEEAAETPCNGCNGATKEPKEIVKSGHELELEHRFNHLKEHLNKAVEVENDEHSDRKSIYLEGELSNDSKILVSATETETSMEKLSHITGDDSTVEEDESVRTLYLLPNSE